MSQGKRRNDAERAELIRRGRAGDSWQSIGAAFGVMPRSAQTAFHRYGNAADEEARRQALKARKFNRPTGYRRRIAGPTERRDPWAGMGECFL